jgi:hypothetical protein
VEGGNVFGHFWAAPANCRMSLLSGPVDSRESRYQSI